MGPQVGGPSVDLLNANERGILVRAKWRRLQVASPPSSLPSSVVRVSFPPPPLGPSTVRPSVGLDQRDRRPWTLPGRFVIVVRAKPTGVKYTFH